MKNIILLISLVAACAGCKALKDAAPNSWNVTYYEPTGTDKSGREISVGVSGALPWGKQ